MITKEVTDDGNMVTTTLSGDISAQEVMNDFFAMFKLSEQLNPEGFAHLYDMSAITSISLDENDIRRMAGIGIARQIHKQNVRTAIIATHPDARQLAALHKNLSNNLGLKKVELFDDLEAAHSWLESNA